MEFCVATTQLVAIQILASMEEFVILIPQIRINSGVLVRMVGLGLQNDDFNSRVKSGFFEFFFWSEFIFLICQDDENATPAVTTQTPDEDHTFNDGVLSAVIIGSVITAAIAITIIVKFIILPKFTGSYNLQANVRQD